MRIAIIGAGFCGLAVAWHILQHSSITKPIHVTLYDAKGIGQGASGIAAGLLHPFSGAHAKLNWRGREGVMATRELLDLATLALGRPVTSKNQGILRLALTEEQVADFQKCAEKYPQEVEWLDAEFCQKLAPGASHVPGLWISQGLTVYAPLYLQGLWQLCVDAGAQFQNKCISTLDELAHFDITVVATGADCLKIAELSKLPINPVKGQVLELAWPHHRPPLQCSLNSHIYLLMAEGRNSCLVGSTYEKGCPDATTDLEKAKREILPKAHELYPPLKGAEILNCYAGMRAATPQNRPLMEQLSPNQWILTGMGSKGLLYHALFAKELAQTLFGERLLPATPATA